MPKKPESKSKMKELPYSKKEHLGNLKMENWFGISEYGNHLLDDKIKKPSRKDIHRTLRNEEIKLRDEDHEDDQHECAEEVKWKWERPPEAKMKTRDRVLDEYTMEALNACLTLGLASELQGTISTGKEANVYYVLCEDNSEMAVKVFKTEIAAFKNRSKYTMGDHHFKNVKHLKNNNRKVTAKLADKEMKNLSTLRAAGLFCPKPISVVGNVFLMSFVGKDGVPAPLLKEADLTKEQYCELYIKCIFILRDLYHKCNLVHADFSEYNLLYKDKEIYVIDCGLSVELYHPCAEEFLYRDCRSISLFFRKKTKVLTVQQLFDFVTTKHILDLDDILRNKEDMEEVNSSEDSEEEESNEENNSEEETDEEKKLCSEEEIYEEEKLYSEEETDQDEKECSEEEIVEENEYSEEEIDEEEDDEMHALVSKIKAEINFRDRHNKAKEQNKNDSEENKENSKEFREDSKLNRIDLKKIQRDSKQKRAACNPIEETQKESEKVNNRKLVKESLKGKGNFYNKIKVNEEKKKKTRDTTEEESEQQRKDSKMDKKLRDKLLRFKRVEIKQKKKVDQKLKSGII